LSRNLVVHESVVGSCFNLKNYAYFHDWFDFVYQVIVLLWVDCWPKFACLLETNEWKIKRWHL